MKCATSRSGVKTNQVEPEVDREVKKQNHRTKQEFHEHDSDAHKKKATSLKQTDVKKFSPKFSS
jgi:hypothetical protein